MPLTARRLFLILAIVGPCMATWSGCGPAVEAPTAPPVERPSVSRQVEPAKSAATNAGDTDAEIQQLQTVLSLIDARLDLMHDVARWKWNAGKPIDDPAREAEFLDRMAKLAGDRWQIHPDETRSFFEVQISAGKAVQRADFARWEAESTRPVFDDAPDLTTELRPRIDEVSQELLSAWAALRPNIRQPAVQEYLQQQEKELLASDRPEDHVRAGAFCGSLLKRDVLTEQP